MNRTMCCQFCRAEMDLAQQFRYLVETQTLHNSVMLAAIRSLPHVGGRPLRVCKSCQADIENRRVTIHDLNAHTRQLAARGSQFLLLAAAFVGIGLLTVRFGRMFA
jgi:hypothetical protein